MSSPPSPLVWFQLMDSATGEPYEGTTVSSVLRSSLVVPVVDQFRKAVKTEYSNKLSSVDAGALLVYKNKAAFDKRNAAVDEGQEKPLKSSHPLDGLGKTEEEEDMLVIVVPSSINSESSSLDVVSGLPGNEVIYFCLYYSYISRGMAERRSMESIFVSCRNM